MDHRRASPSLTSASAIYIYGDQVNDHGPYDVYLNGSSSPAAQLNGRSGCGGGYAKYCEKLHGLAFFAGGLPAGTHEVRLVNGGPADGDVTFFGASCPPISRRTPFSPHRASRIAPHPGHAARRTRTEISTTDARLRLYRVHHPVGVSANRADQRRLPIYQLLDSKLPVELGRGEYELSRRVWCEVVGRTEFVGLGRIEQSVQHGCGCAGRSALGRACGRDGRVARSGGCAGDEVDGVVNGRIPAIGARQCWDRIGRADARREVSRALYLLTINGLDMNDLNAQFAYRPAVMYLRDRFLTL